jgi:hypothetical protein
VDPMQIRFGQLILAEIFGGILCFGGIYLFIRGVSGKTSLLLEGAGLKARLTNGAPGSIIAIIGLALVWMSLNTSVVREERVSNPMAVLQSWSDNSYKVTQNMTYGEVEKTIIGPDASALFTAKNVRIKDNTTLGEEAEQEYSDAKFWHLLAAINKDLGYYDLDKARSATSIPRGALIQAWHVSRYYGMDFETRTRVAAANRAAAYDELLARAERSEAFDPNVLTDQYRAQELDFALSPADLSGVRSLRELSLKYYGDPKYWPLIIWANKDKYSAGVNEDTDPHTLHQPIYIAHFIGWPR